MTTTTVPTEPHEMVEHFLAEAISNSPQPLQDLGKFLSEVLDEDHWKTADSYLLALAAAPVPPPHGNAWRPISEHTKFGLNNSVIVAAPYDNKGERTYIVGEAYNIEPKGDAEPEWWWANTGPGDYTGDPIGSMGYGAPTLFQPLPVAPSEGVEP